MKINITMWRKKKGQKKKQDAKDTGGITKKSQGYKRERTIE